MFMTFMDVCKMLASRYLIADGGHHRWRCLQCPTRSDTSASRVSWGKWVESVRKDVECAFGRLKGEVPVLEDSVSLPTMFCNEEVLTPFNS